MTDELRSELLKEPLVDILLRNMEETEGEEITDQVFVKARWDYQCTEVIIRFADEDFRRMDRRAFRQHVSEQLNAAGDALLAGWDKLHGETGG